ncbi:AMP-binding protein [Pusillimonas sp. MFBS29]|uniref:acyl-CoA synthetase n=1 Tax=Pusillimonas sp. MFBS29 TaxID=2886690 RepID=UPI001D12CB1D|nr:acyl-CoA synthetase [Pusillimonas sp. MFBS29]MCC2596672.1 AMP-binding protein [Pusillimonas sp. MFBS29]
MKIIHQDFLSQSVPNLAYMVTQNARRFPERPALVWRDVSLSWSELDARVSALAAALLDLGVQPGEAVLAHSKNSNEMFEAMLATFRIAAVWVPTNFRLAPDDVAYMAEVTQPRVFLCQTDFPEYADAVAQAVAGAQRVWLTGDAGVEDDSACLSTLMAAQSGTIVPNAGVQRDSACWLFFTSGTTGRPKAAVLTQGQLGYVITNHLCDLMPGSTELDGSLVLAPLSHGAGMHQLNMVARGGVTVLMPSEKFDAATAFQLIQTHGLTNLFTVPTILKMLIEDSSVDQFDHSSLRYVVYAGAPMYRQDQKLALQKLGSVLVQYYGLAEVTGNITVLPGREHDAGDEERRPGTCGFERTGMQVSIQDDAGNEVEPGQIGELCVIGPAVFAGYYNNPEANAKCFRNGWFRTGDLGYRDNEGYIYLTGRSSDMYISGGSNIYPREIEEKMLTHEAVSEVAIVGVADPKWGEVGVAVCVLREGAQLQEAAMLEWMSSRVARYKLPKRIFFWPELPKSGYGKVPKALVRDELRQRGLLTSTGALDAKH